MTSVVIAPDIVRQLEQVKTKKKRILLENGNTYDTIQAFLQYSPKIISNVKKMIEANEEIIELKPAPLLLVLKNNGENIQHFIKGGKLAPVTDEEITNLIDELQSKGVSSIR